MDRFKRYLTVFCIAYILLFSLVYFFLPEYIGMAKAKYDLWQEHHEVRVYGLQGFFELIHAAQFILLTITRLTILQIRN